MRCPLCRRARARSVLSVSAGQVLRCPDCTLLYQWPSPLERSRSYYEMSAVSGGRVLISSSLEAWCAPVAAQGPRGR